MAGKGKLACKFGAKFEKRYNFFKFQFEIALNGYLNKFLKGPLSTLINCALPKQIWRILCYTKLLIAVKGFSKDLVLVRTAQTIRSEKMFIRSNASGYPFEKEMSSLRRTQAQNGSLHLHSGFNTY